jgi:hypothetical protein
MAISSIGFLKNVNQVILFQFDKDEPSNTSDELNTKIIDIDQISEEDLTCLYIGDECKDQQLSIDLQKYAKIFPIVMAEEFKINSENFESLSNEDHQSLLTTIEAKWILYNNLTLLEEIFPLRDHLKHLYVSDRNTFFEELWYILKSNLATSELTILFNDAVEANDDKKGDRPKLIQSYIKGTKGPNFYSGEAKETELMEQFKTSFSLSFEVSHYDQEKSELTALAMINQSPILILGKTKHCNQLIETLFTSLFNGLQD